MSLHACPACAAHYTEGTCACPHCGASVCVKAAPGLPAAAVLMGLALAGCEILPKPEPAYGIAFDSTFVDADEDGYSAEEDCNDDDASIHPGAEETPGDGVDSNCDDEDDT